MVGSNKTIAILQAAEAGSYGVPANVCVSWLVARILERGITDNFVTQHSVEQILACAAAAEAKRSPMILLLFPYSLTWRASLLIDVAANACQNASVPIALHLDHAQSEEIVKTAASMPFDSIMVDMSHYELEENLQKTRELTEYCHARDIATEAEPGRIEGGEDGVKDTAGLESILTTPEIALRFVETGIDFLAPSFGNVHGGDHLTSFDFQYER
jgi:fructose-bisphosphate aldolase class II